MSAFVVNKSHINAMLLSALSRRHGEGGIRWYHNNVHHKLTEENASEVGQILLDECVKSVCYRYDDSGITDLPGPINAEWLIPFKFKYLQRMPKAMEAISITRCYEYQSCEHPEWEASEAHKFCQALISSKIGELQGYDDAPWEWDDEEYYKSEGLIRLV